MKLLFIVPRIDKASTRHRVLQYLPFLKKKYIDMEVAVSPRTIRGKFALWKKIAGFDLVFIQKKLFQPWESWIIRKRAHRVVYDLDDAVMFKDPGLRNDSRPRREMRFKQAVKHCDLVIAGNSYLKKNVLPYNSHVEILPTTVDIRRYRPKSFKKKDEIIIGWIGSRATLHYLEALRDVFDEIGKRFAHVALKIVADDFFDCKHIRVIKKKWHHDTEIDDLQSFDIGVMPLTDDVWARGKCGFKLIQCMAVQVPVLCSPVGMNLDIIASGKNGLFAEAHPDWVKALTRLIEKPELRERLGAQGRKTVLERYELESNAKRFVCYLHDCHQMGR